MEASVEPVCGHKNEELMLQSIIRLEELLREESLPPFPFLHHEFSDVLSVEEIRRTLVVANIDESVSEQELLDYFGNAGEVKYLRFCSRRNDSNRYCLVEFSALLSIINGLKLNNQTLNGKVIKVYHSTQAIEKPSYLKDPESFKQYLLELQSHVEDSYKIVEKASKDVSEYEDYCTDNQQPSKSPLKNTETAIAEIEEALSKVLSAQSLISVALCPVESQLLSILGEALGEKEFIPSSPESFLKYVSQKSIHAGEEDVSTCPKKEPSKSKKTDVRSFHKRHRTRSISRERQDKYHSHSAGGGIGKSHHHHHHHHREHRSRSHDFKTSGHVRNGGPSSSVVHKSNERGHINEDGDNEAKEVSQDNKVIEVKSIEKASGNDAEKENADWEGKEVALKSTIQSGSINSEKNEIPSDKDTEEDSGRKSSHRASSREWHSYHGRRSGSRGGSSRRRSPCQREHHKSPDSSSNRRRSSSSCEKVRRGSLKRRSRSPLLYHYHRHHHHHHVHSRRRHSGSSDRPSRKLASLSSHREKCGKDESREGRRSSRQVAKSHHSSPRRHRGSSHNSKDDHDKRPREKRDQRGGQSVVKVYPESYEEYLELDRELDEEEDAQSSQSEDISKTETASGSGSQNYSINGGECEDKEGCGH